MMINVEVPKSAQIMGNVLDVQRNMIAKVANHV